MSKARQQANLSSDGNLFADISNDRVGVGSVVPTHKLHVAGTSKFDDDVKFEGATAERYITWDKSANILDFSDSTYLTFGDHNGGDLRLYHSGSHSYIKHQGTGNLYTDIGSGDQYSITTSESAHLADFVAGGAVTLRYNGNEKFITTNTGAKVTGNLEVTGVLTYDDVTSIDSVGIVTARAGVRIPAGSTASPSLSAITDTNTGLYFAAADTVGLVAGGSRKLNINSSGVTVNNGDLYIDDKIIHSGDTNTAIRFPAADTITAETSGDERLRVNSNGIVLIGHDTPHPVEGTNFNVQVSGVNYGTSGVSQQRFAAETSGPTLSFAHSRHGTRGSHTILNDNDELGKIRFHGSDGNDFANYGAEIVARVDGTPGNNSIPGRIEFRTTTSGATPAERLRITKEGYVQVRFTQSATTGGAPLYVGVTGKSSITYAGGQDDTACVRIEDEGTTNNYYHGLELRSHQGGDIRLYAQHKGDDVADFVVATDNSGLVERLRITAAGQVTIGNNPTADSNANLHIEDASGECGVWIEGNTGGAGAYLLLKNNSTSSNPKTYIGGVDAGGQGTSQIEFHNLNDGNNEGKLTLHTRPSGGSMEERLTIKSDGKVGINDSSPDSIFSVKDTYIFSCAGGNSTTGMQIGGYDAGANSYNPITIRASQILFSISGNEKLSITSVGRTLIGAGAIAAPKCSVGGLDISSGLLSLIVGGEANTGDGTPRTNSVTKECRIGVPHYTLAEEPTAAIVAFNQTGDNYLRLGGGTSLCNAVSDFAIYTAANTTTTSGTQRLHINESGHARFGTGTATYNLEVRDSGLVEFLIGSSDGGGASIILDGDVNGDGSGADYAQIWHDTAGNLNYRARGASSAATQHRFYTGGGERLRMGSAGQIMIGPIADYSAGTCNQPVYIEVETDMTSIATGEGGATTGLVRIEERGSNNNRYFGIDLRNRESGDIRLLNYHEASDRGALVIAMPSADQNLGIAEKIRISSTGDSVQIMGKGGPVADPASDVQQTDVYIKTKTDMTTLMYGEGGAVAGLIRFEDKGGNNNRYHGIDLRNKNNGDIRILNQDVGTSDRCEFVIGMNMPSGGAETMRINQNGHRTNPKQPYFHVQASPEVTNSPYDNSVKTFDNIRVNNGSHYDNSTGVFTCPTAGFYWFSGGIWASTSDNSAGTYILMLVRRDSNGNNQIQFAGANHRTEKNQLTVSSGYYCASGDKIYLEWNGSIQGSTPRNYFSGCLIA